MFDVGLKRVAQRDQITLANNGKQSIRQILKTVDGDRIGATILWFNRSVVEANIGQLRPEGAEAPERVKGVKVAQGVAAEQRTAGRPTRRLAGGDPGDVHVRLDRVLGPKHVREEAAWEYDRLITAQDKTSCSFDASPLGVGVELEGGAARHPELREGRKKRGAEAEPTALPMRPRALEIVPELKRRHSQRRVWTHLKASKREFDVLVDWLHELKVDRLDRYFPRGEGVVLRGAREHDLSRSYGRRS